jgi:hypothetical protein
VGRSPPTGPPEDARHARIGHGPRPRVAEGRAWIRALAETMGWPQPPGAIPPRGPRCTTNSSMAFWSTPFESSMSPSPLSVLGASSRVTPFSPRRYDLGQRRGECGSGTGGTWCAVIRGIAPPLPTNRAAHSRSLPARCFTHISQEGSARERANGRRCGSARKSQPAACCGLARGHGPQMRAVVRSQEEVGEKCGLRGHSMASPKKACPAGPGPIADMDAERVRSARLNPTLKTDLVESLIRLKREERYPPVWVLFT